MLSSTSRFQTTASGISQDSRSYDNNMSSNTTSSSFVSNDEVSYFKQTKVQVFRFAGEVTRVAIRLALGGLLVVFQSPVRRPAQHQAGRVFVLLFETTPPVTGPPAGHRSVVCYERARASAHPRRP